MLYCGCMPPPRGMPGCCAGTWACPTSSGESTADSPSTPFSLPVEGSGAFRHPYIVVSRCARFDGCFAYLDKILAFRFGHEWLELRGGKGVDESGFRNDEQQDLGASENRQLVSLEINDGESTTRPCVRPCKDLVTAKTRGNSWD